MNDELESSLQSVTSIQENSEMPRRRDCVAIKTKLFEKINGEEYTETLDEFFQGKLPKEIFDQKMKAILITPKTQKLHNMLMSSIIFNSHFSVSPPTNIDWEENIIETQRSEYNNQNKLILNQDHRPNELHCLPSIEQLNLRMIKTIVDDDITDIEFQAVEIVYESIISYILLLLENCVKYTKDVSSNQNEPTSSDYDQSQSDDNNISHDTEHPIEIEPQTVLHIIETDPQFSSIFSSDFIMKYKTLIQDS